MNLPVKAITSAIFGLCCCASSLLAQEPRKIVLSEQQFRESFLEKVTVSGGIRAGLMYPSSLERIDVAQLYIHLRQEIVDPEAQLCVNMVSRDGRYSASWQYALGKQPAGMIQVALPTKYQSQIGGYSPEALVVLAALAKGDCSAQDVKYIPASWGEAQQADYVVYVNSGNTDTIVGIPGHSARIPCSRIAADSTVAYDTKCVVAKELISEPKSIYLLRSNFGNKLPNVEFPVR